MPSTRSRLTVALQVASPVARLLRQEFGSRWRPHLKYAFQQAIDALTATEPHPPAGELSLYLTTDLEMRALNNLYRGIEHTTDVLSFNYSAHAAENPETPAGEIIISVETAQRQAPLNQHDLLTELLMLALHGTLHMMGYDDSTEAGRATMNARAASVLRQLGYAAHDEWYSQYENA